jgi:hypothetical protein
MQTKKYTSFTFLKRLPSSIFPNLKSDRRRDIKVIYHVPTNIQRRRPFPTLSPWYSPSLSHHLITSIIMSPFPSHFSHTPKFPRVPVEFPQPPPDVPIINVVLRDWDPHEFACSSDAFSDWLNARWRKTGYAISREIVWCILKINGRLAFQGIGNWDGRFVR